MYKDGEELVDWFHNNRYHHDILDRGQYVNAKVRRDIMLNGRQCKVIIGEKMMTIKFESMDGGVWRAYI